MALSYSQRIALFFGALFLIYGVHLPFLPLWLEARGLTASQIALVVALPYFLRLGVSPGVAFYADRSGAHRRYIIALASLATCAVLALSQAGSLVTILPAAVFLSLSMTTIMPLTEVLAVTGVRLHGSVYGRMRLWGSVTFIVASTGAAWVVGRTGVEAVVWLLLAACAATAIAAWVLPSGQPDKETEGPGSGHSKISLGEALALLRNPIFILFLLACGVAQAAHAAYYSFGSIHWARQGISPEMIGILWALGVIAEIVLFNWSGYVVERVSTKNLILLGAGASVLRWGLMSLDPVPLALVFLQLLHALTFGASHLAAIHFIAEAVGERLAGTAQALYATTAMGVAMGAATLVCGSTYATWGGDTYLLMAGFSLLALWAAIWVSRLWSGGLIVVDDVSEVARARG